MIFLLFYRISLMLSRVKWLLWKKKVLQRAWQLARYLFCLLEGISFCGSNPIHWGRA